MFDKDSISIGDIKSESIPALEYIASSEEYKKDFEKYSPEEEKIQKITAWIKEHDEKINIRAFGASWCVDCTIQLPRLIKVSEKVGEQIDVGIYYGIKVKPPYAREEGKVYWKVPPSQPETIDTRFDMFKIPAMYLFTKDGKCIGKINEKPEHTPSLEGDILHHLQNS